MAEFTIRIENVDAYTVLGKQIPLNKLVKEVESAEYMPEQFPGIVYRISDPRSAALIFSTGKIVCTGAKSIEDARLAVSKVVEKIKSVGIALPDTYEVHIDNIVAATKIDAKLNLGEISFSLESAEYDPDKLQAMVYRPKDLKVTLMIFRSGKIICTGARSIDDIYAAMNRLKSRLEALGIKVKPVAE